MRRMGGEGREELGREGKGLEEVREQRHDKRKKTVAFYGEEVCSIASGGIDTPG